MTLRRKDDWDEALEEARIRAIARGDAVPVKPFVPGRDYDYGKAIYLKDTDFLTELMKHQP
jgi:hypothetical protein